MLRITRDKTCAEFPSSGILPSQGKSLQVTTTWQPYISGQTLKGYPGGYLKCCNRDHLSRASGVRNLGSLDWMTCPNAATYAAFPAWRSAERDCGRACTLKFKQPLSCRCNTLAGHEAQPSALACSGREPKHGASTHTWHARCSCSTWHSCAGGRPVPHQGDGCSTSSIG